jgi:hypothetical protein
MFEQILALVKDHIGNDPQIAQHIPPEQADAVHQAIAEHVTNTLQSQSQPTEGPAIQPSLGGPGALTGQTGLGGGFAQAGPGGLTGQGGLGGLAQGGLGGLAQGGLGGLAQGGLGGLAQGGLGGLVSQFTNSLESGSPLAAAIEGGLVGSLGSRFGLGPAATGAIAAALPGLLQRMTTHR